MKKMAMVFPHINGSVYLVWRSARAQSQRSTVMPATRRSILVGSFTSKKAAQEKRRRLERDAFYGKYRYVVVRYDRNH